VAIALGVLARPAIAGPSKDPFVQAFLTACVASYSEPAAVAKEAKHLRYEEVTGEAANRYLSGHPGRVWVRREPTNAYAISLLTDGSCSVFVQEGDAEHLQAAVESWLPPPQSRIAVAKEQLAAPEGLRTFRYTMRGGKVREEWTLTLCVMNLRDPLRAIITYRGL
jgi:hypothetical protein